MLYAVNFRNEKEELIIRAIEAQNEEEACENLVSWYEKEYGEKINWNFPPQAVPIVPGEGIYWGHR